MMLNWFEGNFVTSFILYALSFIVLFVGSLTDLKTREVPDWVNYGLILAGIGLNLLFSIIYSNPYFIINSIIGLVIFFGIAYIMFYAGQWGGGDSKILMGLGAAIGMDLGNIKSQFLLGFFINALFAGAVYGLMYSLLLVFRNKRKFRREFKKSLGEAKIVFAKKIILAVLVVLLIIFIFIRHSYLRFLIPAFAFLLLATFYLWIFTKALEKSCMYKLVEPEKLTEGDWIVKDIVVNKEYITGPKDLGIEKKQIRRLMKLYKKGKVRKILIKEGIPFVPSFLIAFIITFLFGNPLMWIL